MLEKLSDKKNFISIFLLIVPFFSGLYFAWGAFFSAAMLLIYLLFLVKKNGKIVYYSSKDNILILLIFISAVLSTIFGFNPGTSVYGILKVLSILLLILIMMQEEKLNCDSVSLLSISGILMMILSILITLNPGLRLRMYSDVYGETQFSSFIQYPNVTSLFFIISFIVLSYEIIENKKEKYLIQDIIFIIFSVSVLAVGVVWTKSRYGIILFLAVFLFLAISKKELRKIFIPLLGVGAYACVLYFVKTGRSVSGNINIFKYISSDKSFQTRLFQYQDAISMIIKHPLGLGFSSYYELLPSFQRAKYFIRYVHNGYLSIAFSFGWIAALSLILLIISKVKKAKGMKRMLIIVIAIHFLFDTALDFMAIVYIFAASMDWTDGKKKEFEIRKHSKYFMIPISILISGVFFWLGTADIFSYFMNDSLAARIYPYNSEYIENEIAGKEIYEETYLLARRAYRLNSNSDTALDVIAKYFQENDDFDNTVLYYRRAINSNRYNEQEYMNYKGFLNYMLERFSKEGNQEKKDFCNKEIEWINDKILEVKKTTYEKAEEFQMTLMI